jgi:hypothetical protein
VPQATLSHELIPTVNQHSNRTTQWGPIIVRKLNLARIGSRFVLPPGQGFGTAIAFTEID